ncbi:tetratricopeptide repeat protein [Candidatus Uabimicrobium sp. HlEnr_7]|uniref:tetratricopeptide repeat protein n=1 Tax=Candidatus Uabimicrobium helgolandensis TaxID=3095367 RepID=UPI0035585021
MDISTQILQKIQNKKAVFFCGAGISLEPPAGLPNWKKLRDFTLESIAAKNELLSLYLPPLLSTPTIAEPGEKGITPEVVASEISANCKGYFESFRALKDGKPNINHMYLAKMASEGLIRHIITTNFDTFIEEALSKENVPFYVCRTEEEFSLFDEKQEVIVLKLHGCITLPETITSTVEQEAKGLSFIKSQAIRTLIGHYSFIFWGYSGADLKIDLDYLQLISCKERAQGFYWHFVEKDDFVEEVNSNVQKLVDMYGARGEAIHGIFPQIFKGLFPEESLVNIDCTYEEQQEWQKQKNQKLKKELKDWAEINVQESEACTIIGNLLYHNGQLQEAHDCYARAIDVCKERGNKSGLAASLSNCGGIYRIWGQYDKALSHYQLAENIAREQNDYENLCVYLNNIGKVHRVKGDYLNAASYYKDSAKLNKQINNGKGEGIALNNLGMAHFYMEDYDKAQLCYESALQISQKVGDKQTVCAQLNNIGNIHGRLKDSNKSLHYYSKALDIALALGDKNSLIVCWNNLGVTSRLLENYSQAKEYFLKSLQASQFTGDLVNAATTSKNLAIVCEMEEQYTQAIDFYEMSIGYFRSLQDNEQVNKIQNRISKLRMKEDVDDLQMPSSILHVEEPLSRDEILSKLQVSETDLDELMQQGKISEYPTPQEIEALCEQLMMEQTIVVPVFNVSPNVNTYTENPQQIEKARDRAMSDLQIEPQELLVLIQQGKLSSCPTTQEIEDIKNERMMQATMVMSSQLPTTISSLGDAKKIETTTTKSPSLPTATNSLGDTEKAREKAMSKLQIDPRDLSHLIQTGKLSTSPTDEEIENVKSERMMQQTVVMNNFSISKEREALNNLMNSELFISTPENILPFDTIEDTEENIEPIFIINPSDSDEKSAEKLRQRAMNELQVNEEELEQMIVRGDISAIPTMQEIQNLKNNMMMQETMHVASSHMSDSINLQMPTSSEKPHMVSQMRSMSLEFPKKSNENPMMEIQRRLDEIPLPSLDDLDNDED